MPTPPSLPSPLTLTQQVTQILLRGLEEGMWTDFLPGEVELSRILHVSRMTLRASLAALTKEGRLAASRGKKRRIIQSSRSAGTHATNRSIVLLSDLPIELMSTLHILQVEGLRARLATAGYRLDVHVGRNVFSRRPVSALEELIKEKPAAAWILLNSTAPIQQWFMERAIPSVIIGSAHPDITIPSIGTDYWALGRHAAGLFLRRGHRKFALIVPDDRKAGHVNTELGFRAAIAGVPDASIQVIRHSDDPNVVFAAVANLYKHSRPTGFLVAMPPLVLTTFSALIAAGASLPHDVSLISRDSDMHLTFVRPSIARYVIDVPSYVKKIYQSTLLVARGSMPRIRAQQLQRDFIPGETLGNAAKG